MTDVLMKLVLFEMTSDQATLVVQIIQWLQNDKVIVKRYTTTIFCTHSKQKHARCIYHYNDRKDPSDA